MDIDARKIKLNDAEKKQILQDILGENYSAAGRHFPLFSMVMDYHGQVHDAISLAELISVTSKYISGSVVSRVLSTSSFVGVLLFPVSQLINLINVNQTGQRAYSYRCIAYTISAWAFSRPIPQKSTRILQSHTWKICGKSRYCGSL